MSEFKELEIEENIAPELKVYGDELKTNGDQLKTNGNESDSGDRADGENDSSGSAAEEAQKPAEKPDASNQPIAALVGIRDRMDSEKKRRVLPPHDDPQLEGSTISSLAKPIFILVFLLVLPWVLASTATDWSVLQRYRCNSLGATEMQNGHFAKAKEYFQEGLLALNEAPTTGECAKSLPDRKATSLSLLAGAWYMENDLGRAASNYQNAGDTATTATTKSQYLSSAARAQVQLGQAASDPQLKMQHFELAATLANSALSAAKENDEKLGKFYQGKALIDLSLAHLSQGNFRQALNDAAMAKPLMSPSSFDCYADSLVGDIQLAMGDKSGALKAYTAASNDITDKWLGYIRQGDFRGMNSNGYSGNKEYYLVQLRAKALALFLQGHPELGREYLVGAQKMLKMIDLSQANDAPPLYNKGALDKDMKLIP